MPFFRHERVQKRWLGSARIPLAALQRKVDGHLALRGPLFHTGYRWPSPPWLTNIRFHSASGHRAQLQSPLASACSSAWIHRRWCHPEPQWMHRWANQRRMLIPHIIWQIFYIFFSSADRRLPQIRGSAPSAFSWPPSAPFGFRRVREASARLKALFTFFGS